MEPSIFVHPTLQNDSEIPLSCWDPPPPPDFDGKNADRCRDVEVYLAEAEQIRRDSTGDVRRLRFNREVDRFVLSVNNSPENLAWFEAHNQNFVWSYFDRLKDPEKREAVLAKRFFPKPRLDPQKVPPSVFNLSMASGYLSGPELSQGEWVLGAKLGLDLYLPGFSRWGLGANFEPLIGESLESYSGQATVNFLAYPGSTGGTNRYPLALRVGPAIGSTKFFEEDDFNFHVGGGVGFSWTVVNNEALLGLNLLGVGANLYHLPEKNTSVASVHFSFDPIGLLYAFGSEVLSGMAGI